MTKKASNPNTVQKDKTDYRFKILYALGIIFIVAGHGANGGLGSALQVGGWFPFYSFHLALFMFCSGYFYKLDSHNNTLRYIFKKIKHLLLPLFLWNIFYGCFVFILSNYGFEFGMPLTIEKFTTDIFTTGHQFVFNLGGWFVIPLFMTQVFTVVLRKVLGKWNHWSKEWVLALLYFALGILGIWLARKGWRTDWALVLTRMLALMPFYGLGILYKTKLEKHDKLKNWLYFLILFTIQFFVILRSGGKVPTGIQSWSDYKAVLSTILVGITGIAFWLRISKILEPTIGKSRIINLIANNTFPIMIHQFLGFWILNLIFAIGTSVFNTGGVFNWEGYHTSIFYKYLPYGYTFFEILYLIAGIGVPILISKISAFFKKKLLLEFLSKNQFLSPPLHKS